MSESRHHNQARNIVEYAWRFRNHNDDIPRQYLTDILVGNIAEALRLAYATSHEKEYQDEKARRVYYQDIVYDVCNTLDRASGRSVAKGQGVVCGTKDEPHDNVQRGVKEMAATITRLSSENAALRADLADREGMNLKLTAELVRVKAARDAALAEVERVKQFIQGIADRENPEHYGNARDELHLVIKSCKELLDGPDPGYSALTPPAQQNTQGETT